MKRILVTLLFAVLIFNPASAALSSEGTLNTGASEASDAHGSTFYVDASSGDDRNDGFSPSSAWKSLPKVNAANLFAGDEVLFKRGEMWIGTLSISTNGTKDSPLTFGAYGEGLAPIIDGNRGESAIRISGDYIFLQNLTATGNTTFGIFVVSSANYVTLENVTSYDHKYGIGLISSKTSGVGHVVRNCTVYDASRSGIVFDARDVTITNCTIHDNGGGANPGLGHAIYATNGDDSKEGDGCDNGIIEHNTIYRTLNQGNGINFKCGRGIIRYNTISETEGGIHLEDQDPGMPTGTVEIYGNVIYGNNGGIVLYDYNWNDAVTVKVFNNTTYNNNKWDRRDEPREFDLQIDVKAGVEVKNNIFYNDACPGSDHDCYAIRSLVRQSALDSDHNCVFKGDSVVTFYSGSVYDWEGWKETTGGERHSLLNAPSFIDATHADFHLAAGSACIDAGTDMGLKEDGDGVLIPQGAGPDIGAFEFFGDSPTFVDVPYDHWAHDYIEALYQAGYVAGCSNDPLMYCPESTMTRAESAVFVARGVHGAGYMPSDPTEQVFVDVPLWEWFAKWAKGLWEDGYTAGCGTDPLIYCPLQEHTRTEGTVFFLRMLNGADYVPPDPTGIFVDVSVDYWGAKWIEAAYSAGLIPACAGSPDLRFCPDDPLDRAMAAYMMVQAKGLNN